MIYLQVLANGLMLGGLYAAIAVGFSLVWGVLNVINLLHGSFIVLGAYVGFFCYMLFGLHPFLAAPLPGLLFAIGYGLQGAIINRVIRAPVLMTLTLTFGLDLLLNNAMLVAFKADYRKVVLDPPLGSLFLGPVVLPIDRLAVMALALLLTYALYRLLRDSGMGRAIVAVRMDREAAALMGVSVLRVYAVTFGIGAVMAGRREPAGIDLSDVSPLNGIAYPRQSVRHLRARRARQRRRAPSLAVSLLGVVESFGSHCGSGRSMRSRFHSCCLSLPAVRPPPDSSASGAMNERRKSSFAARGSLALAACRWFGGNYALRFATIICDVCDARAVVEFHRRLRRISVVCDRGLLRARQLCLGDPAELRTADPRSRGRSVGWQPLPLPQLIGLAILRAKVTTSPSRAWSLVEVLRELVNISDRFDRRRHGAEPAGLDCECDATGAAFLLSRCSGGNSHSPRRIPGRPQPTRVCAAMHPAERGGRDHARRQCARCTRRQPLRFPRCSRRLAGGIYASWVHYIDPADVFDVLLSVKPLVMVLLGGLGTLLGPVIGAGVLLVLEEVVWRNFLTVHAAVLGLLIVALVLFMPDGILAIGRRRLPGAPDMTALLQLINVSRAFKGVHAIDDISLTVTAGEVVGLIGPNGAGKTTLVNVVTAVLPGNTPAACRSNGRDVTRLAPNAIARLGSPAPSRSCSRFRA